MLKLFVRTAIAVAVVIAAGTVSPPLAQEKSLTIFAAASMKNALDDINTAFTKKTSVKTVASYAATSALMRQIERGAGGRLRLRRPRMDGLRAQEQAHQPEHAREPVGQPAGADRAEGFQDHDGEAREGLRLGQARRRWPHRHRRGEIGAVGRYAVAAMQKLGMWASVEKRMAMVENVRVALTLVARGEAVLGIVYETDAKVEPGVKIVAHFPPKLASRDRLSGRRDRESQRRSAALHRLPAIGSVEVDIREIRLQLPGKADVITSAPGATRVRSHPR